MEHVATRHENEGLVYKPLPSSRGSVIWYRNYGARARLSAKYKEYNVVVEEMSKTFSKFSVGE